MKKQFIAITVLLGFWTAFAPVVTAQTSGDERARISGIIEDTDGSAIPNATVAVYNETETEIITGTSSEQDGSFSLEVDPGSYVLRVSYVSYRNHFANLDLEAGESLELGTIQLQNEEAMMDEVIVEGE